MVKILKRIIVFVVILVLVLILGIIFYRIKLKNTPSSEKLKNLDSLFVKDRGDKESIIFIEKDSKNKSNSGNTKHLLTNKMGVKDKFYLASISKLYTHSIIFKLVDEKVIDLSKPVSYYLKEEEIGGILMKDGKDHTSSITLKDLIDQTSGLFDYELDIKGEKSVVNRLKKEDISITPKDAIELTKDLKAKSLPNDKKAYYSNLNAILLGMVAEKTTGLSLEELYKKYIFNPLKLTETEVIKYNSNVLHPYLHDKVANRTKYASSSIAPGGVISNAEELMIFIKAFFNGELFSKSHIENVTFRPIQFFPLQYGSGMMKVEMGPLMSPLIDAPEIIGHAGLTGSFAFYCPSKDIYIVGTLNQFEATPFKWIYQYIDAF